MRGKAQRDSPILVQSAPPDEYDWIIRQLPIKKTVATTVQSKFNKSVPTAAYDRVNTQRRG